MHQTVKAPQNTIISRCNNELPREHKSRAKIIADQLLIET